MGWSLSTQSRHKPASRFVPTQKPGFSVSTLHPGHSRSSERFGERSLKNEGFRAAHRVQVLNKLR